MKKLSYIFLFITSFAFAQNKPLLYNFTSIPQSLLLNPGAEVNYKWHAGFPLLSHIHASAGASGVTVYDVFADNGVNFNDKLRRVVYNLDRNDYFTVNQQLEIFSGGFAYGNSYEPDKYLSFGLYQELDIHFYYSRDYAILAYEGNQNNIGRSFDLGDLNGKGELLSVLHVGITKKVNKKWTYGVRGKIYSSLLNFKSTNNSGSFITTEGTNNFYNHNFDLNLQLQTSGYASLIDLDNDGQNDWNRKAIKELRKRVLFGGNLGLGLDAGFTYHPKEQWTITGSIQDIGFIYHTKDVETYTLKGQYTFEGVNPLFPNNGSGQTADEYWQEITENFEDLFELDTITTNYMSWRSPKINGSASYKYGKKVLKECNCTADDGDYLNEVGLQFFAIGRSRRPQLALSAFYYRRLFNFLSGKVTYTVDGFSKTNIGVGLSSHIGNINFYIMADNLLEYQNLAKSNYASVQLGFNYIFPMEKK
ncbi:hypothetical protein C8N46_105110 [Kordia periserrulae]|uniref:DUF5723 domain-containing protein n=1 Tax=Kordia periserrulae TaxID=701523 RepID=A0A2T6BXY8_9FLAO|nr:DUF5723 family protein [Kordia periserrulae]PTX60954.1 hypothetical protein C8N46_105110 [Kordia periserrulae]